MKSFITYLTEKKDHIIKRLKNLTDDEKDQVIAFFSKKPNLENKINWQNRDLTFKDFQGVMDTSKTERRKAVKKQGIRGLKEGKDFLELKLSEDSSFSAYVPLHHEASKLIGSSKIGGVEGKWCISANDIRDWKRYVYKDYLIPVMFVDYTAKEKYTLMLDGNDLSFSSLWDQKDKSLGLDGCKDQFGPHWKDDIVPPNVALLKKARTIFDGFKDPHWFEEGVKNGKIKVSNPKYKIIDGDWLVWLDGTWHDGTWLTGTWKKGTWEDGRWERGLWQGGLWKDGTWGGGTWEGGDWIKGTWEKGHWEKGTWKGGRWEDGTWSKGTWEKGTWEGGTWRDGDWEDGDWGGGNWKGGIWWGGDWNRGIWHKGIWWDGDWEDGEWKSGTWKDGTWGFGEWHDGTWKGGEWLGGYDKYDKYHEEGDSPDKWTLK